jgi:poly(3-hydroxybutyrate) depolymerase
MYQANTAPRSRTITASTDVDVLEDFGAPIQMIQNNGAADANVTFNGGSVPFVIKVAETLVFQVPLVGVINSDAELIALA